MAVVTSPWSTLRFRRSKDVKGWALLGIPQCLYSDVMQPLFERQTRFIEKHERGEFVNVLFEAPVALAARLALAFPAPPSCEPLVVNQAGTRLLYGKFARSPKARHQGRESDAWPGLQLLSGDESFWQMVMTLSNATPLPLQQLSSSTSAEIGAGSKAAPKERKPSKTHKLDSAVDVALQSLAQEGLPLQRAEALTISQRVTRQQGGGASGLDDEGFEDDEWEQDLDEEEESATEVFEDVWETKESADFGENCGTVSRDSVATASVEEPLVRASRLEHAEHHLDAGNGFGRSSVPVPGHDLPPGPFATGKHISATSEVSQQAQTSDERAVVPLAESVQPSVASAPQAEVAGQQSPLPGRYCSGLLPNPSDAGTLKAYHTSGLTVADAIARTQQQEADAFAEQSQRRRIQLPFEHSPTLGRQPTSQLPNWLYANTSPLLPEESWAAAEATRVRGAAGISRTELELDELECWQSNGSDCPALSAASQPEMSSSEDLDLSASGEAEWGYYDPQGYWVPCDPSGDRSLPMVIEAPTNTLVPAPTEIVCTPVAEEQHVHILLQGVDVWNAWRADNPHIRPNLRGAYLNNLGLAGADFHDVDLRFAFLFRADLREADLSLALLVGADLIRADLGRASLWGAALAGAYFSHANLAGADLTHADIQGVYWQGAILDGAIMPDGQWFESFA